MIVAEFENVTAGRSLISTALANRNEVAKAQHKQQQLPC